MGRAWPEGRPGILPSSLEVTTLINNNNEEPEPGREISSWCYCLAGSHHCSLLMKFNIPLAGNGEMFTGALLQDYKATQRRVGLELRDSRLGTHPAWITWTALSQSQWPGEGGLSLAQMGPGSCCALLPVSWSNKCQGEQPDPCTWNSFTKEKGEFFYQNKAKSARQRKITHTLCMFYINLKMSSSIGGVCIEKKKWSPFY